MTQATERVPTTCPSCSPQSETVHELLRSGGQATVRCTECGHVHKTSLSTPSTVRIDVVVSQDGESFTGRIDRQTDETLAVGDEFIVETESGIFTVQITSIEVAGEQRVEKESADTIETIWSRAVGNVAVPVTIHPKEGTGDRVDSHSDKVHVPGDYEFAVGDKIDIDDIGFQVEGIHIRDEADGYRFDKLDHEGDTALAKDIKRVFGRDTTTDAWSAW